MIHADRRFCVTEEGDEETLAHKLTERTWTGCTAFAHRGYLLLNDAFSEDGAQEYAVFRRPTEGSRPVQIESITFGWMDADEALRTIRDLVRGEYDDVLRIEHDLVLQTPEEHGRCPLCA